MTDCHAPPIDLCDAQYYLNRELSRLDFNDRVLHEALDPRTRLLERLKFVAIFSSNLDEYFMVHMSGAMEQAEAGVGATAADGLTPGAVMDAVRSHLAESVAKQHHLLQHELRPALDREGVRLLDYAMLETAQQAGLDTYFSRHVFPVLTPLGVDAAHPFPKMANLRLNLAVTVEDPDSSIQKFARVKMPDSLPRFALLPGALHPAGDPTPVWVGVPLEQVISHSRQALFPGMRLVANHLFRITRDADFPVKKEDEAEDLLLAIEQEISKRRTAGFVCRLEIEGTMPPLPERRAGRVLDRQCGLDDAQSRPVRRGGHADRVPCAAPRITGAPAPDVGRQPPGLGVAKRRSVCPAPSGRRRTGARDAAAVDAACAGPGALIAAAVHGCAAPAARLH